ncbi:hypothetical protein [Micromonospora sp. NPDC005254]|uniref:hypothetical protein n=1 Tax=Micromonospora sp. NPDC005254 TaxID=3364229 RepID=UPI0036916E8B
MAPKPKIQNADEAIQWITEGRTYTWMTAEHERKYSIRISPSGWSYFRRTHGLDPRQVRDEELIPWGVEPRHKYNYLVVLLRAEARRRAGKTLNQDDIYRVDALLRDLKERHAVVHYDPDTEEGFHLVPREPEDEDIIRQPAKVTRKCRSRDPSTA